MIDRRHLLSATLAAPALAQERYPARPVALVNPFAPGGQPDPMGRLLNSHLHRVLGQPFVVENRAGAGSTLGGQFVARAAPDGYTLLIGTTSTFAIAPYVYRPQPYDPTTAFAPIAALSESATAMVTGAGSGLRSVAEVVVRARARPGDVTFASSGNGSLPHIHGELFAALAGIRLTHVPFRGIAPAMTEVIAGRVDLVFDVVSTASPHVEAGRTVALLTTGAARSALLPQAPTGAEAGYPGLNLTSWMGLAAPAGTPAAIIERLNAEVNVALRGPEMTAFLGRIGAQVIGGSAEQMADRIVREATLYRGIIANTGISTD